MTAMAFWSSASTMMFIRFFMQVLYMLHLYYADVGVISGTPESPRSPRRALDVSPDDALRRQYDDVNAAGIAWQRCVAALDPGMRHAARVREDHDTAVAAHSDKLRLQLEHLPRAEPIRVQPAELHMQ